MANVNLSSNEVISSCPDEEVMLPNGNSEDRLGRINSDSSCEDDQPMVFDVAPRDKFWLVYLMFYFLGITTLLPWNFFVNADKYWNYKFRTINDTLVEDDNSTEPLLSPHTKNHFQASFASYLAISANVPTTLTFFVNSFIAKWISANLRMTAGLFVTLILFLLSTTLVKTDTDTWQYGFFVLTIVSVVFMNTFCSFFQCGLLTTVGKFPPEYTTASLSGQALGGIFAAVANLWSIFVGANQLHAAYIYFILGSCCLLISVCITLLLPKTMLYKFYVNTPSAEAYRWVEDFPPEAKIRLPDVRRVKSWMHIFKDVWIPAVSAMLIFVVTLAAFPALVVLIVSENPHSVWNEKYYVAVVSFLVYAVGDYMGRIASGKIRLPSKSSIFTLIFSILRIFFIPMILMCNLHPRSHLPVVFQSDIEFSVISYFFGFTNGYLANIVFINTPQLVPREDQEDACAIVTTALGIGLSIGVTLSYFLLKLL